MELGNWQDCVASRPEKGLFLPRAGDDLVTEGLETIIYLTEWIRETQLKLLGGGRSRCRRCGCRCGCGCRRKELAGQARQGETRGRATLPSTAWSQWKFRVGAGAGAGRSNRKTKSDEVG